MAIQDLFLPNFQVGNIETRLCEGKTKTLVNIGLDAGEVDTNIGI